MSKQRRIEYIAIGTKGTAGCLRPPLPGIKLGVPIHLTWSRCSSKGWTTSDLGVAHSRGRATIFPSYDLGCFVSKRKEEFEIHHLKTALKKGIVEKHRVTIELSNGELKEVTVYSATSANWTPQKEQLQVLACDGVPALRIETLLVNDARNEGLIAFIAKK